MKQIRFILVVTLLCNIFSCQAQEKKKVTDKTFQTFLDKFKPIHLPLNYKKNNISCTEMTGREAILFLNKKESDLQITRTVVGEDETGKEVIDEEKEDNTPCCDFQYQLDDSIIILCTREGISGGEKDTALVVLNSFSLQGKLIDRGIVGGAAYYYELPVFKNNSNFILFDKNNIRVFYYDENTACEGFQSTVYYINYEITSEGKFVKKNKSEITYLKNPADFYFKYDPKLDDDPMNEYDFKN